MLPKKKILGVGVTDASKEDILEYVVKKLGEKGKNFYIVTPNPEILVASHKKKSLQNILNNAELALNDGVGVSIASKFMGKSLKERFSGTDFVKSVCEAVAVRPITVGFLGGRDKIAEMSAECLISQYPGLKVVFAASEWEKEGFERARRYQSSSVKHEVELKDQVDLLFVAFGFPKQEEWMVEHQSSNIYKVAIGVGGAFDYISGKVPRAPGFVRAFGFEWLFRLIVQPWRIKRQLALLTFIKLVLRERLTTN